MDDYISVNISSLTTEAYSRYTFYIRDAVLPQIKHQAWEGYGYHGQQERVFATDGE
jgi:hypothetical protein